MPRSHRFVRMVALSAGMALVGGLSAGSAAAQGITFTPYVGSFFTASSLVDFQLPSNESFLVDQANTAAFGARLSVPISGGLSIEGAFAYSKSDVVIRVTNSCNDGTFTWDCSSNLSGNVLIGSGRLLLRPRRSNLHGILGASYIKHSGAAWDDSTTQETSDIGAVIGFGLRASVTPKITLSLTAEANIYSFDPDGDGSLFDKKTQQDLMFTVGIPIGLSR